MYKISQMLILCFLFASCAGPRMKLIKASEQGGVISFKNYRKKHYEKWKRDILKTVHCPERFKLMSKEVKTQYVQDYLYIPQKTTTTSYSNFSVSGSSSLRSYGVSGTTTSSQYSVNAFPYTRKESWTELSYRCLSPLEEAIRHPESINAMNLLCQSGNSLGCLQLAKLLEKTDPTRFFHLTKMICEKKGDPNRAIGCYLAGNRLAIDSKPLRARTRFYKMACDLREELQKDMNVSTQAKDFSTLACGLLGAYNKNKRLYELGTNFLKDKCVALRDGEACYNLACLQARYGELGKSIKNLKKAIEVNAYTFEVIKEDPDLKPLLRLKEFRSLKMGSDISNFDHDIEMNQEERDLDNFLKNE